MNFLDRYVSGSVSVAEDFDDRLVYREAIPLENGRFAVFWSSGLSPSTWGYRVFEADGSPVSEQTLGFSSNASLYFASVTDVSTLPDGGFLVTWIESFENKAYYLSQYNADGQLVESIIDFVSTDPFTDDFLRASEGSLQTSVSETGAVLHAVEDGNWKRLLPSTNPIPDDALSGFLSFTGAAPGPLGPVQFADAFTALGADYNSQMDLTFVTGEVAVATWVVGNDFLQPSGVYGQLLFADATEASAPFSIYIDDRIEGGVQLTALENGRFVIFFYDGDDDNFRSFIIYDVIPDGDDAWQAVPVGDRVLVDFSFGFVQEVSPTNDGGFIVVGNTEVRRFDNNGVEIPFDAQLFNTGSVETSEIVIDDVIQLSTGEFVSFANFPVPINNVDPSYVVATIFDLETQQFVGTPGPDELFGTSLGESISGLAGNDIIVAGDGNDTIEGGDGVDTIIAGNGDDVVTGGASLNDLRDVIYGGAGDDNIDGGYGNDELRGDAGNDSIAGGFGVDTVIGGTGNDVMTGSAFSDLVFGGDGNDFVNGGFGSDRINGGDGADRFFHIGIADHGSDWIQDFSHTDGDVMVYGGTATIDQFQVNVANTANAGDAGIDEALVIYRPTGQILWALVDGMQNNELTIRINGADFDLLA